MDKNIFATISERFSEEGTPSIQRLSKDNPSTARNRGNLIQQENNNKIYEDDEFFVDSDSYKQNKVAEDMVQTYCNIQNQLRLKNISLLGNIFNPSSSENISTMIAVDELLMRCQNLEERNDDQVGIISAQKREFQALQEEYEKFAQIRDSLNKEKEILLQKNLDSENQIWEWKKNISKKYHS